MEVGTESILNGFVLQISGDFVMESWRGLPLKSRPRGGSRIPVKTGPEGMGLKDQKIMLLRQFVKVPEVQLYSFRYSLKILMDPISK